MTSSAAIKISRKQPSRWWPGGESLGPRGLLPLWSQVQTLGCSYDGHWRLTWSLTPGPVGLVEVRGMEAVLALYMRILLFILLQTLFWIPFTLLLWVAFVLLPSLPLARFLHGAMAVSVHWGMYHRELFPRLVEGSWDGKTRHISTTGIHSSAITASEWCWQRRGRFGIGEVRMFSRTTYELSTENLAFVRLETKDGTPAVVMWSHASRIAGGGYHCLALTGKVTPERHGYSSNCNSHEGQVLSWGFDGHCQLGHSSIQCQKIPAVIDALADQHAIHVTCGGFIVGSYNW
uniref:Uncharacterized protein n=1 Tax=Populus alba TaxID=43335 RepID=A0A4V6XX99_POPAL|nr:hypothetical protein D5086_0000007150 [Populus alba]